MRIGWSAPSIVLVLALVDCGNDGLGRLPGIGVSVDISEQTIRGFAPPATQSSCTVNVPGSGALSSDALQPISLNLRDSEELRGQSILRFTDVELEHVDLSIIPPSQTGQTWDFLDSIRLFASAPGHSEVLVAVLDPVPRGQTTIRIEGTGAEISDIASEDRFQIRGEVAGRPPCADVHFDGEAEFDVSF